MRDGTRIAVDVIRPAVNGTPVEAPLPVLYTHTRYLRAAFGPDSTIITQADGKGLPYAGVWLSYGYVLAASDLRGTGASFGSRPAEFLESDATDAYDVIEWLGSQPWSSGNVGMYGNSYPGMTQWMAAGEAPPSLKAIVPLMTYFDLYSSAYPGGVFQYSFISAWGQGADMIDKQLPPVPVDADTDGSLAAAAQQEHISNTNFYELTSAVPFRDGISPITNQPFFSINNLPRYVEEINRSKIAVYNVGGWYDLFPRDAATWFVNLTIPQRLLFTPFSHNGRHTDPAWFNDVQSLLKDDFSPARVMTFEATEQLRFFDYYLKGIDNGFADEPPVWYYVMGAPTDHSWRSSSQWPLPNEVRTNFYFQSGQSDSFGSVNDGLLDAIPPTTAEGQDDYIVDYTTTLGQTTRWQAAYGAPFHYGDMTSQGQLSLTYTTLPLTEAVEITGHPIVHLWVTSSANDGDFFVYLEKVDTAGYAHYLTEGVLRASHRALATAPYNYMGLPYHRSFEVDVEPLVPGEPSDLVFDLMPTSIIFAPGDRIRVRIVGADADTFATPKLDPAPTMSIYHNTEHSSYIDLPIIPTG